MRRKLRATEEKNAQQLAQICRKLADLYHDNNDYNAALEHYEEEARAYKSLGMTLDTSRAYRMVGEMYMLLQNFDEALKYELKYLSEFNLLIIFRKIYSEFSI